MLQTYVSSLNKRIDNLLYLLYENKYRVPLHMSIPIRMKYIGRQNPSTLLVSLQNVFFINSIWEKKKKTNSLTTFYIFYKSDIEIFIK